MINELEVFQDILFISCPWLAREESEHKYLQELQSMPKQELDRYALYESKFQKPLNARRKYYHRIIENEAIHYLNEIHGLLANASTQEEKKYIIHKALTKRISTKLKEVEKVITENNLVYDIINPINKSNNLNAKVKADTFIIQFLKYQLLWLYLEIQDNYAAVTSDDNYTKEELHQKFFFENLPDESIISKAPELITVASVTKEIKTVVREPLVIHKGDFRPAKKGILSFDTIIKNPGRFISFEEELYEVELITHELDFTDRHTQKQYLAAIYHALIKKGYFNKRDVKKQKDITDVMIRKFLDHRYNADVDAQFRTWSRDREALADYLQKQPWISQLPTS